MRLRAHRREPARVVKTPFGAAAPPHAQIREDAQIAAFVEALRARPEPSPLPVPGPVTEALYARLAAEDIAAVEAVVSEDARTLWDVARPEQRPELVLAFGALYGVPGVLERTGLAHAHPPAEIHAMARGILAYGGEPLLADLVTHSFAEAGLSLPETGTLLDFGCSSGRIIRVLAAYRPELDCAGCDPNAEAIAWAEEHLPMARFLVSPTAPPLELADASIDRAFAISIWSHFDAASALAWLEEMHRVVKPGGALLLTTHGLDTLSGQLRQDVMTHESAADALQTMLQEGHKYFDVFGADGDWGVKDPGWGNSYTAVDWLAAHATPAWAIRLFRPGMLAQNQDVFVLERCA